MSSDLPARTLAGYRSRLPIRANLESAEGADKVHAYLKNGKRTLCGRPVGATGGFRPTGMEWFTDDELASVDPNRPCARCRTYAAAM